MQDETRTKRTALLIIDVQNDFISGSLAIKDGALVVPIINKLREDHIFEIVVTT